LNYPADDIVYVYHKRFAVKWILCKSNIHIWDVLHQNMIISQ